MDRTDVEKLVAEGESDELEFKTSTGQLTRAGETLCAFLNARMGRGRLLFGISSDDKVVGQAVSDKTRRDIAAVLAKIEPHAEIQYTSVSVGADRFVLVLQVEPIPRAPLYTFDGRAYQRSGPTTSRMPSEEMRRRLLVHPDGARLWEVQEASSFSFEDLDHEEILRTVRTGAETHRIPEGAARQDIEAVLDLLELRQSGKLLNAAVVLYGKKPWPVFSQCELLMARFKGTDKAVFVDQRDAKGHVFHLLREADLFLRRHIPLAGVVPPDKMRREDEFLYPFEALREALINALIHRDYSLTGSSVNLAVFEDRLEVWSPGGFPDGIRPSELSKPHRSVRRNHLIAEVVYRAGLIERWGRGTLRMLELCADAGIPAPTFQEKQSSVVVTFTSPEAPKPVEYESPQERLVAEVLAEADDLLSRPQIGELLAAKGEDVSVTTLKEILSDLVNRGIVERRGHARATRYLLVRRS